MSGIAGITAACQVVCDYIPNDYRAGTYIGAAGGALVACCILKYFDGFSQGSSKKIDDFPLRKEFVLVAKGMVVTFCAATGGAIGFISYIR